jgi:hypothetical protein
VDAILELVKHGFDPLLGRAREDIGRAFIVHRATLLDTAYRTSMLQASAQRVGWSEGGSCAAQAVSNDPGDR